MTEHPENFSDQTIPFSLPSDLPDPESMDQTVPLSQEELDIWLQEPLLNDPTALNPGDHPEIPPVPSPVEGDSLSDTALFPAQDPNTYLPPVAPSPEGEIPEPIMDPYGFQPTPPDPPEFVVPEKEPPVTMVVRPKRKGTSPWAVAWSISKFLFRLALGLVLAVVVLAVGLLGYLSVTEYNPSYAEAADRGSVNRSETIKDRSFRLISFNTGYGALGEDADFFMDGGESVNPDSKETVEDNMEGIRRILNSSHADFIFLQEVDTDSDRSFEINQWLEYEHSLEEYESRFALNYSCSYVPYPLSERIGKVHSGLATYSLYDIVSATRYSLPNPFSWPTRVANLKRCLLLTRVPIEGSEQELVLINVHMEAYDDGEGKQKQTEQLLELIQAEYEKGNYVIAGGDFNQTFPGVRNYPIIDEELWTPGTLEGLPYGWKYAFDKQTPTCRLLNQPYEPNSQGTQYYVIDGFIVSPNVNVDRVKTMDHDFEYSDHNPVILDFTLLPQE